MQRAMAQEAEAERERRAKIVAAEGEYQAAVKLGQAADIITEHPVALQLRTLQTMAEISVEKNSTIIFPAQFMTTAGRKPSGGCRRIQHQNSLGVNPGAVAIQAAAIRDRDQARLLSPGRSDGSSPRLSTISLTCRGSSRCRILREGSKKVLIKVDARIAAHSQGQKRLWRPFDRHVGSTSK